MKVLRGHSGSCDNRRLILTNILPFKGHIKMTFEDVQFMLAFVERDTCLRLPLLLLPADARRDESAPGQMATPEKASRICRSSDHSDKAFLSDRKSTRLNSSHRT